MNNIQIRLWEDCYNNCSFCSLKNKNITSINDKKERINKLLQFIESSKINNLGIIGGEFFEGQLKGIEPEWLNMIKKISCNKLFITANLLNEQYLLQETLKSNPNIIICTSYDTTGRFKNEQQKNIWLNRIKSLLPNVFCTIIPTQDIINDTFINNIPCNINLCEPHLGIIWYKNVDKQNYHNILIKENTIFNLPKRLDLLKWLLAHPQIINNMKNYKLNHFSKIISFDKQNNFTNEYEDRFIDNNFINTCGHPYFSLCYADSNKCLCCDINEL